MSLSDWMPKKHTSKEIQDADWNDAKLLTMKNVTIDLCTSAIEKNFDAIAKERGYGRAEDFELDREKIFKICVSMMKKNGEGKTKIDDVVDALCSAKGIRKR